MMSIYPIFHPLFAILEQWQFWLFFHLHHYQNDQKKNFFLVAGNYQKLHLLHFLVSPFHSLFWTCKVLIVKMLRLIISIMLCRPIWFIWFVEWYIALYFFVRTPYTCYHWLMHVLHGWPSTLDTPGVICTIWKYLHGFALLKHKWYIESSSALMYTSSNCQHISASSCAESMISLTPCKFNKVPSNSSNTQ